MRLELQSREGELENSIHDITALVMNGSHPKTQTVEITLECDFLIVFVLPCHRFFKLSISVTRCSNGSLLEIAAGGRP